jgi:hypothetical protein
MALGPSPFHVEAQRRRPGKRLWIIGILMAIVGGRIVYQYYRDLSFAPELTTLLAWSVSAAVIYMIIRRLAYKTIWLRVSRTYPLQGRVHPAARGELPRNHYLLALLTPGLSIIVLILAARMFSLGNTADIILFATVAGITALGDIWALTHCLAAGKDNWILETERGLDTLRPVG